MPPAKLELLKIPSCRGIVRKKILTALGLQECIFAAGGAAPMPPELLRWYNKLGLDLAEVYGMTENCGVSHMPPGGKQLRHRRPALRRRAVPPRPPTARSRPRRPWD
jgi:long-chain acyl-CoA synthetase